MLGVQQRYDQHPYTCCCLSSSSQWERGKKNQGIFPKFLTHTKATVYTWEVESGMVTHTCEASPWNCGQGI